MRYLFIASTLLISAGGCVLNRQVEIEVPRTSGTSSFESRDLTPVAAERLFREVAAKLEFEIHGPILLQANHGILTNYSALPSEKSSMGYAYLRVYISEKSTIFHCGSDNFANAQKLAIEFEQTLDEQGVRYSVTTETANPFNN